MQIRREYRKPFETLFLSRVSQILNNSAIQLVIPNMLASTTSYACKLKNHNSYHGVALNDVFVGYPPARVKNFRCRSPNWQFMNCTFDKPYNPVHVTYTLNFRVPNDPRPYKCKLNDTECIITVSSSGGIYRQNSDKYLFNLSAHNKLADLMEPFEIDHYSIVVPDPAVEAAVREITPTSAKLQWKRPYALQTFEMCKYFLI